MSDWQAALSGLQRGSCLIDGGSSDSEQPMHSIEVESLVDIDENPSHVHMDELMIGGKKIILSQDPKHGVLCLNH